MLKKDGAAQAAAEVRSFVDSQADSQPPADDGSRPADEVKADEAAATVVDGGRQTPAVWSRARFPTSDSGRQHPELWQHSAAELLHGWREHEHHEATPIRLLFNEYEGALKAACEPDKQGEYQPHLAALSKHAARAGKG